MKNEVHYLLVKNKSIYNSHHYLYYQTIFFDGINNYNLGLKQYTFYLFFFYGEM